MKNFFTSDWHVPTKEELKQIKRLNNKRLFNKSKTFILFMFLALVLIYLATFASFSSKRGYEDENSLTLIILTGIIIFVIIVFFIAYKVLYSIFYGKRKNIEEVTSNAKFLYHHMVSGVEDTDKLYAIVVETDGMQIEILVDKNDYDKITEETNILLGRYREDNNYKYFIYY